MPDQTQFYLTARKQTPTKPRVCILCPLRVCFGSTMTDSARADPSRPKLTQSGHIESIYRFQKQAMQQSNLSLNLDLRLA